MADKFEKVSNVGFKVIREVTTTVEQNYTLDYINDQKADLQAQIDNLTQQIAKLDDMANQAKKLGVVTSSELSVAAQDV